MKTAVIIHGTPDKEEWFDRGRPSCSNSHWLPWLQKELLIAGYLAETPEMPQAYWPDYDVWKENFERYKIGEESILVGHSCGGGFLLRYLSQNPVKVERVILVAPWLDPFKSRDPELFNFMLDADIAKRFDMHMIYSDNDMESVGLTVARLQESLPNLQSHLLRGCGHFCLEDMGTPIFPELLNLCLTGKPA